MGRFGGAFSGQRAASTTEGDCSRGDRQGCSSSLHYYFRRLTLAPKDPPLKSQLCPHSGAQKTGKEAQIRLDRELGRAAGTSQPACSWAQQCFTGWVLFLPGQVEQGLFGVVTGIGAAFIEDQTVILESQSRRGMWKELEECGDQRKPRSYDYSLASSSVPVGFFLFRPRINAGSVWSSWQTVTI